MLVDAAKKFREIDEKIAKGIGGGGDHGTKCEVLLRIMMSPKPFTHGIA